jgi:pimeloyl-ACP methyl ester carboxylesterase
MTWENLTADADALRESLGFDKWAVLGHSFGGKVALEYALRYPDSLSHLILLDTAGDSRAGTGRFRRRWCTSGPGEVRCPGRSGSAQRRVRHRQAAAGGDPPARRNRRMGPRDRRNR